MKKLLLFTASLMVTVGAFAQGSVIFNNRYQNGQVGAQADVYSPVYGVDPLDPTTAKHGNTTLGTPMGAQTYGGSLLSGTGFTAQLWGTGGTVADASLLTLCTSGTGTATTTFRTSAATVGSVVTLVNPIIVQNAPADAGARATLQLRVWNNLGGTVTTWAAALNNPAVAKGSSTLFTPPFDLGFNSVLPPTLQGLTSFNLTVPEPSAIALGVIGLGSLMFLRRRK